MMEGCHQVRAINAILTSTAQCYNGYQKSHFMDNNILMIWFYVQYFNFIWFMKSCHAQESSIFCWNCLHSLKWMMNVWGGPLCCDGSVSWPCLESRLMAVWRWVLSGHWRLLPWTRDSGTDGPSPGQTSNMQSQFTINTPHINIRDSCEKGLDWDSYLRDKHL